MTYLKELQSVNGGGRVDWEAQKFLQEGMVAVQRGFSILEFIMVMALVSIMGIVVAPLIFRGGDTINISSMARKIMADMRYAQELGMARRATASFPQPVRSRMVFDTVNNRYEIKMVNDSDGDGIWGEAGEEEYATDPATRGSFSVQLNSGSYSGISISSATFSSASCNPSALKPAVEFDLFGVPYCIDGVSGISSKIDSPGTVVISKGADTAAISVRQNTGMVTLP